MSAGEKSLWNKKYKEGPHRSMEPEPLLLDAFREFLADRPPGTALDVAGGAGRHALWLVQRGWRVRLVDISEEGVALARENVARTLSARREASAFPKPMFEAEVVDLNSGADLGDRQYDLVLVFFFLQRRLFPALVRALKPGGFLIYETYTVAQQRCRGGPGNPDYLLQPHELLQAFHSLRILHYREHVAEKAVAELVAQKANAT